MEKQDIINLLHYMYKFNIFDEVSGGIFCLESYL
jgi:hypothetical protein